MPSSISSSSDRVPRDARGLTIPVAVILFAIAFGGLEVYWHKQGHRPFVTDDLARWACHRARVSNRGHKTVVLLGASRIQCDFCSDTFRDRFPQYNLVNLAIAAAGPALAPLRDLAEDVEFNGIVICSTPNWWLRAGAWAEQQEYVDYFHQRFNTNARINVYIRCFLQSRLVALSQHTNVRRAIGGILSGDGLPAPRATTTHFDRSLSIDFSKVALHDKDLTAREPQVWNWADINRVEAMVRTIQARGGEVAFVTFPISGPRVPFEDQTWPRRLTWDRLVAVSSAAAIHYRDTPSLANYECPDMSHLDQSDKASFTNALLDKLVRRRVLRGTARSGTGISPALAEGCEGLLGQTGKYGLGPSPNMPPESSTQ